jgi:3-hydroxyisobutyrate dehydrogenase
MTTGFIGLGNMGGPMAANLLRAGLPVLVHDARREAAREVEKLGGRWAESPAACAAEAETLITMLPNPRIVTEVMLGANGAASALRPGTLWIDMSTSTPEAANRVRAQVLDAAGVRVLDAPVSGMATGARTGMLQIFAGGDEADFRSALPHFEILGDPRRILHVGGPGAGYAVKLMINLLWFSHLVATSEVLAMGVKAGVRLDVLRDSLLASPAASNFLENDIRCVLEAGDYDESFALALACKDLGLAVDLGREVGVATELSAVVEQIYRRAKVQYGDLSGEMIPVRLYEEMAGAPFRLPMRQEERIPAVTTQVEGPGETVLEVAA